MQDSLVSISPAKWGLLKNSRELSEGVNKSMLIPSHLPTLGAESTDLHQAALTWFSHARFGLFLHYGLYSLIGKGEWYMHHAHINPEDYARWKERFTADGFDAEAITDLALRAGMRYVTLTTRHHDGFCLFETAQTDFNSLNTPARRDLVGELAAACNKKGLGLFLYYSYGLDWRHPDYDLNSPQKMARYVAFMKAQIRELLTQYGPIAGVWFDPVGATYAYPQLFELESTYKLIWALQAQALIAYKQGSTGTEDFASCEFQMESLADFPPVKRLGATAVARATAAWAKNRGKHNEICTTLQEETWGYHENGRRRRTAEEVRVMLANAAWERANLLLNASVLPDGSIHRGDRRVLCEIGACLDHYGWPAPAPLPKGEAPLPIHGQGAQLR